MATAAPATEPAQRSVSIRVAQRSYLDGASVCEHIGGILEKIRTNNDDLGAFVDVADDRILDDAIAADRLLARRGASAFKEFPLLGVSVSVKDLIQTAELSTRRGSRLPNRRAARDAPVVARLRRAGALVIGKTATSEYGWSASTVGPLGPPTRNPWSVARSAGGSSGGSAAAVAAGIGDVSIGTDGAGSVRIPAAFCGVVGFKPSLGRVPYVPPSADQLAHVGPLARSVADVTKLMAVITGPDPRDPDSFLSGTVPSVNPAQLRIGWIEFPNTSDEVRRVSDEARSQLLALGHHVEELGVPFPDAYDAMVTLLAAGEASMTPAQAESLCDPGRLAIVRHGRSLAAAAIMSAQATRLDLRIRLCELMRRFDILAMATVPEEPFAADAIAPEWAADPEDLLWLAWSPATYPFNLTGQPALSLPVGLTAGGLPVGVQLVGRVGDDSLVLTTAESLERQLDLALVAPSASTKGDRR